MSLGCWWAIPNTPGVAHSKTEQVKRWGFPPGPPEPRWQAGSQAPRGLAAPL